MSAVAPPACTKRGEGRDGSASGAGAGVGAGAGSGRGRGGGGGGEEAVISCRAAAAAALRGDSLRIGGLRVHVQHRCPPQAPKKMKCNCGYGFLLLKPSYPVRARTGKLANNSDYIRTAFGLHSDSIQITFRLPPSGPSRRRGSGGVVFRLAQPRQPPESAAGAAAQDVDAQHQLACGSEWCGGSWGWRERLAAVMWRAVVWRAVT